MIDILSSLNEAQRQAVTHLDSPLLILAGPGSGKTTVISAKIAWLIHECAQKPEKILAMTFTNKAAREMLTRVQNTVGITARRPYISTFHSFGAYLLRRFSDEARLTPNFQIYDADDSLALLKQITSCTNTSTLRGMLSRICRAKDFGLCSDASDEELEKFMSDQIDLYREYERVKANTGNVDFGDLLIKPYKLLQAHQHVKASVQRWWHWFLIDEYQDTNHIQFLLLKELCDHTHNICVVGDDDQSIYKFRGATVENILTFDKHMANAKVIKLEQNYRSTPSILELANAVIAPNSMRHGKRIFSTLADKSKPVIVILESEDEESNFIVETVRQSLEEEKNCALFFRINAQSRSYETALRLAKIPYILVGATNFYMRAEVKDTIALARVANNPKDLVSFARIANKPARGIGEKSLEDISIHMQRGLTWQDAFIGSDISAHAKKGCKKLLDLFDNIQIKSSVSIGNVCEFLLEHSGLAAFYQKEENEKNIERMSNIEEFINYAHRFENTSEGWVNFLEQVSLHESAPHEESAKVQLMTLHRSKGLEFDTVIMCASEEGIIPMINADHVHDDEEFQKILEEERRLFYVGITRAKEKLYLTTCDIRSRYGQERKSFPSSFLRNCGDFVETQDLRADVSHRNFHRHYGEHKRRVANTSVSISEANDVWQIGERVYHRDFGLGFVRSVKVQGSLSVVRVEFDNEREGDFIPKFDSSLQRARAVQ